MVCTFAHLDESKLEKIRSLEQRLGKTLLVYSCKDVDTALVSEDELSEIKRLESELGVSILAVR